MESIGSGWPEPVAMEFPMNSPAESPVRMPRRIRRRLLEAKSSSSPSSVEAIEAKLREADLRRQVNFVNLWCFILSFFLFIFYWNSVGHHSNLVPCSPFFFFLQRTFFRYKELEFSSESLTCL
jgi:hypothetical protein